MKEIDFIPEWYRTDRVRKRKYVRQYTLIGSLSIMMMMWSFIVGSHVNRVSAEVQQLQRDLEKTVSRAGRVAILQDEIAGMKVKTTLLERITPRTKLTAILGEIAYLMRENIILSKLLFKNEPIGKKDGTAASPSMVVVKVGNTTKDQAAVAPQSPSRLKVVLAGIAAQQSDAASLIAQMEETPYFEQVSLVFSRPKTINQKDVTEFEIECTVADYRICK